MKRFLLPLALAAGLLVAQPAGAATKPFAGVVVAKGAGTLLVAGPRGTVRALPGRAAVGSRVTVRSGRVRVVGRARVALVRGVVVRRSGSTTFLSASSRLLALRSARTLAVAAGGGLQPGTVVQSRVAVDPSGTLTALQTQPLGSTGAVQLTATVAAVAPGSVTLTVNGQTLTIPLPAGLTLPATLVGTQVQLSVSFAGGTPTATTGDDEDDDEDEADDDDDHGSASSPGHHDDEDDEDEDDD